MPLVFYSLLKFINMFITTPLIVLVVCILSSWTYMFFVSYTVTNHPAVPRTVRTSETIHPSFIIQFTRILLETFVDIDDRLYGIHIMYVSIIHLRLNLRIF